MANASVAEKTTVLVVDDDDAIQRALERQLRSFGGFEVVTTSDAYTALGILQDRHFDIMVCDYLMPGLNGVELLALARKIRPRMVAIMLTGCHDISIAAEIINRKLADFFVTKPWTADHLLSICSQARVLGRKRLEQSSASLPGEVVAEARKAVYSLARAVDARDSYTYSHSGRVAMIAEALGRRLGISERELDTVRTGGLLHDIGKIGVPDQVLKKPGPLSEKEKEIIKKHPLIGLEILGPLELKPEVYKIVSQHHENLDGSGYPFSLAADNIHPLARIVRVADAYEAMASDRVYRSARQSDWIRKEFERYSESQFDPVVSKAMIALLDSNGLQALVA